MKLNSVQVNYSLFLLAFFVTAKGNIIAIHSITMVFLLTVTLYFFVKRGFKVDKAFVWFSLVYLVILAAYFIKFGYLDFRTGLEYIKFFHAYILIKMIWQDFGRFLTKTVYVLAIISLPLYFLQLYDYQTMKLVIGIFERTVPLLDYRDEWYENLIIFTLNDNGMYRNSGFAWEPKGFGVFLCMALFFQLINNNFKLLDRRIFVYLAALVTTFSTASILVLFFAVLPFYIRNKKPIYGTASLIIFAPLAIIAFLNLDFLQAKVIDEFNTREKYTSYVDDTKFDGETRSLGRFGSFLVDYADVQKEPIFGYGNQSSKRTMLSANDVKLVRVNGFSDFMAKYGVVGVLFLFAALRFAFKRYEVFYNFSGGYWIIIGVLMISFASAILFTPIFLMLLFFPFVKLQIK